MLTLRKIGSGNAAGYSQYLTGRADDEREAWQGQGDYYTGDGVAGEWTGDASTLAALGVENGQSVEREALARALRGERADTGARIRSRSLPRTGAQSAANTVSTVARARVCGSMGGRPTPLLRGVRLWSGCRT